jgi:3-phenylpropionate/cinnamic acid dioxygenase small subunit
MNDYEMIRRLIALYPQLLDAKRLEEWGGLFAEDAIFDVFGRTLHGRTEIVREIGAMQPAAPLKHAVFAPIIELDDVDRARAWTDFATLAAGPSGIAVANFATYHDRLAKRDGRWRIVHRTIVSAGEQPPADVGFVPGA